MSCQRKPSASDWRSSDSGPLRLKAEAAHALLVLMALADRVDEHAVSYTEGMVKMRIFERAADHIADLVKNTGTQADVRDV
jgi:hypothetical protein